MSTVEIKEGDCLEVMRRMAERGEAVQAVVTDPPYDLVSVVKRFGKEGSAPALSNGPTGVYARASRGFMGKQWDGTGIAFRTETWRLCYDLLPPGGWLLAFGGTRTWHRMAVAIEDAGFEVRDTIMYLYGTGFPKSHDVSKAIDAHLGARRTKVVGRYQPPGMEKPWNLRNARDERGVEVFASSRNNLDILAPATEAAHRWQGWGTTLKPSFEPIVMARKPLQGTVAENVLAHGTGALNIDACRIHAPDAQGGAYTVKRLKPGATLNKTGGIWRPEEGGIEYHGEMKPGRWPANLVHDGSDEVEAAFAAFGERPGQLARAKDDLSPQGNRIYGALRHGTKNPEPRGDSGSASRFFYSAKATAADRAGSKHPTVKPIALLRWLVRLVTPPGGTILDPFAGSGTTGAAALAEGFNAVLIEREKEYLADIHRRFGMVPSVPVALHTLAAAHVRLSSILARL